jgi:hypothetical protein
MGVMAFDLAWLHMDGCDGTRGASGYRVGRWQLEGRSRQVRGDTEVALYDSSFSTYTIFLHSYFRLCLIELLSCPLCVHIIGRRVRSLTRRYALPLASAYFSR